MNHTGIVTMKSVIMDSQKDLGAGWNGNDYQRKRVERVADLIEHHLVTPDNDVMLEGRSLKKIFSATAEQLNKDAYSWVQDSHKVARLLATGSSISREERLELVVFMGVFKDILNQLLGR
jgi:hypothetical protein